MREVMPLWCNGPIKMHQCNFICCKWHFFKTGRCLQIKYAGPTRHRSAKLDQRDSLWVTEHAFKIKVKLNVWLHVARKHCFGTPDELYKKGYNTLGNINISDPLTAKKYRLKNELWGFKVKKHAVGKTLFAKTLHRWSCDLNIVTRLICGLNIQKSSRKPLQPFDSLPAFRQRFNGSRCQWQSL